MKPNNNHFTLALTGQPNVGKSTVFNMLTGARQHVANFPGLTVEKKEGTYRNNGSRFQVVDLPGTYSLTSYSLEERVARGFIINDQPDLIVTTVDASNLERNLYFVLQIIEMGQPALVVLNMMDIATSRGIKIDLEKLSNELGGIKIVPTVGNKSKGGAQLKVSIEAAIHNSGGQKEIVAGDKTIDYGEPLELLLDDMEQIIRDGLKSSSRIPPRWAAIKLMENDEEIRKIVSRESKPDTSNIGQLADSMIESFIQSNHKSPNKIIASQRYKKAGAIVNASTDRKKQVTRTLTDKVDEVVLHRLGGPIILFAILFGFYEVTMNLGTRLADWFFPFLNRVKEPLDMLFGASNDLLRGNLVHSLVSDGIVAGVVSILYYVPIFLVLFALIAILEDSGYMTRVAFIMDRIFRTFGLHGQSTLPLILGGVIVGGCAVPGVLATRAIKDEKARMITILIMPMMNCLAKIPFYILIVGMFFSTYQGLILFSISIFTFVTALLVAKFFSRYLIKGESAPFIMELPAYHMPTVRGVLRRTIERTWLFIKKVVTIVMAVMVLVWFFILFPGIGLNKEAAYDVRVQQEMQVMIQSAGINNPYTAYLQERYLPPLFELNDSYRKQKVRIGTNKKSLQSLQKSLQNEFGDQFLIVNGGKDFEGKKYKSAQKAAKAFKVFTKKLKKLKRARKKDLINHSFAASFGRFLEPVTQFAGFNWKINVAVISTFAAKESLVGTLGMIYNAEQNTNAKLSDSILAEESGWTIWHALAILILVALFPPCLATLIMVKNETQSYKWTFFAAIYPIILGFIIAVFVFQFGTLLF